MRRLSSSSTTWQSLNQVLIAVGDRCCSSSFNTACHTSLAEFKGRSSFISFCLRRGMESECIHYYILYHK